VAHRQDKLADVLRSALEGQGVAPPAQQPEGTPLDQLRHLAVSAQSESVRVQALKVLLDRYDQAAEREELNQRARTGVCPTCGRRPEPRPRRSKAQEQQDAAEVAQILAEAGALEAVLAGRPPAPAASEEVLAVGSGDTGATVTTRPANGARPAPQERVESRDQAPTLPSGLTTQDLWPGERASIEDPRRARVSSAARWDRRVARPHAGHAAPLGLAGQARDDHRMWRVGTCRVKIARSRCTGAREAQADDSAPRAKR
jgi:hypothetical protein